MASGSPMIPLPVDGVVGDLVAALKSCSSAILTAPPGAGKSTRVPRALMAAGLAGRGEIVVLQPRRLAARLIARRVAGELEQDVGKTVGYQVRLEEVAGPETKIRFVTEGILTRWMLSDPELSRTSAVVLDEFHERHMHTDLALGLLRRLQKSSRPDLKLVIMSATLDPGPLSGFLDNAPHINAGGRLFDVATRHASADEADEARPLERRVAAAIGSLMDEDLSGDVLVFLPGMAEIRRCAESLEALARRSGLDIALLHGSLPLADQERAVLPGPKRKVILSTNVAETSVTVQGVTAVVDSGLARIAGFLPNLGMNVLKVGKISRASAQQRAGRAGRLRPGTCLRLYTSRDYATRPEYEMPEIARLDLAEPVLLLHALGVRSIEAFDWFEAPPAAAVKGAHMLLQRLDALSPGGELTGMGRAMLRFPLHPRLSRLVIEADNRGRAEAGAVLAALLSEPAIRKPRPSSRRCGGGRRPLTESIGDSDLIDGLELFEHVRDARFKQSRIRSLGLDMGAVMAISRTSDRTKKILRSIKSCSCAPPARRTGQGGGRNEDRDPDLLQSILAGFPDRVAKRRGSPVAGGGKRPEFVLCLGGSGVLDAASVVQNARWIVAVDLEQRKDGARRTTMIRQASGVDPDWLVEMFFDRIQDTKEVFFNADKGRVEAVRRMAYEQLIIEENPDRCPDPDRVAQVLFAAAKAKGIKAFDPDEKLQPWLARVAFLRRHCPELGLPLLDETELHAWLREYCAGKRSLKDLAAGNPVAFFESKLKGSAKSALEKWAPKRIGLASGRSLKITYPADAEPCGASRLQDFFGMTKTPALAKGRAALILHLLAPNRRAVQVTTDLEGFWKRHYPEIAKE
ncbi:MAG: ATP-dependent helicase C-terminal domain-containing protein, partial [Pseudomonadota bacterium]